MEIRPKQSARQSGKTPRVSRSQSSKQLSLAALALLPAVTAPQNCFAVARNHKATEVNAALIKQIETGQATEVHRTKYLVITAEEPCPCARFSSKTGILFILVRKETYHEDLRQMQPVIWEKFGVRINEKDLKP